jgi:hypothetical protein
VSLPNTLPFVARYVVSAVATEPTAASDLLRAAVDDELAGHRARLAERQLHREAGEVDRAAPELLDVIGVVLQRVRRHDADVLLAVGVVQSVASDAGAEIEAPAPKMRANGIPSAMHRFGIVKPCSVTSTPIVWKPSRVP